MTFLTMKPKSRFKIYTYEKACDKAYKEGRNLSEMFFWITVPGWDKKGWVRR